MLLGPEGERGRPWPQPVTPGGWREADPPGRPPSIIAASRPDRSNRLSLGWVVVAERGREEVLAPLWSFAVWLGLGTLGVAALGGLLAGWNAGRYGSAIQRILGSSERHDVARRLEALRDQAWRDPLTGLLNRAGFEAWTTADPKRAESCAVVAMDLDGFKPINDRYGHAAGDAVLSMIGEWLRNNTRLGDAAVRTGGGRVHPVPARPAGAGEGGRARGRRPAERRAAGGRAQPGRHAASRLQRGDRGGAAGRAVAARGDRLRRRGALRRQAEQAGHHRPGGVARPPGSRRVNPAARGGPLDAAAARLFPPAHSCPVFIVKTRIC